MALGDYLASLDLAPGVADKLGTQYGPPAGPIPPPVDPYGAPTPDEMAKYGASPADIAAAQRANGPGAAAGNPSNPVVIDPKWDPEAERKRTNEEAGKKERAAATPQGPAGPDGFPTYKDPTTMGGGAGGVAGPAMPVRLAPAHWQPGSRGETRQEGFNPDELQSGQYHRDVAAGQRMLAGDKNLEAAQQQGMADAVYAASHAAASKQVADQMQAIEVKRAQYVQQEQQKLAQLSQAASEKVDPDAAKGSAGAQLMAAIGIAIGQFGASLNGGQNTALQIVQNNIDRNIRAQEANIANAGKRFDREQGLYRQNLEAFGDKERAALATKVQYLDQVKAMADQQYAAAKNTANEGAYHSFVAAVNDDRAKAADDFAKLTHTQVSTTANEHYVPAQMVGGAGAGAKGREKLYVPTLGGYARDEETARKLNTHAALRTQINEDLHEMHGLLNEAKGLSSVSDYGRMQEVRQRIDALKHGVLQKTTVLADQGAMSKGDQTVAEVRSGLESVDPQLKTSSQIERMQKGLVGVAKSHQRDARLEGEANGLQLGRESYMAGPSGPEARANLAGRNKEPSKETQTYDDLIEKPKGKPKDE